MIRFRLKELLAEKSFQEGRNIGIAEVSKATDISRGTVSKIANERGYNTVTANIDKLCAYFDCRVEDLMVYIEPQNDENRIP